MKRETLDAIKIIIDRRLKLFNNSFQKALNRAYDMGCNTRAACKYAFYETTGYQDDAYKLLVKIYINEVYR